MQPSQNFQIKMLVDHFTQRNKFLVHDPSHIKQTDDHYFHVWLHLWFFGSWGSGSFPLAILLFHFRVVTVARKFIFSYDWKKVRVGLQLLLQGTAHSQVIVSLFRCEQKRHRFCWNSLCWNLHIKFADSNSTSSSIVWWWSSKMAWQILTTFSSFSWSKHTQNQVDHQATFHLI